MKDLLVLTADKDAEFFLQSLLGRIPRIEKIREFTFEIKTHPRRDPGVVNQSVEYVRSFLGEFKYLLVFCDYEGCGKENIPRSQIETDVENNLANNGWMDRNRCIIFEPELESWLWVNKAQIHKITDWDNELDVYEWLKTKEFVFKEGMNKPERPKEAFEMILRNQKIPFSPSLFANLAGKASYSSCIDPSFDKFITTIKRWFSEV